MYHMKGFQDLAVHRSIGPSPLLSALASAARAFVRWWGDHQAWPANEPVRLDKRR